MITRTHALIKALWAGDVPLATAFWEYAIVYGILINAACAMGSLALFSMDQLAFGLLVHFAPIPYEILILVAVWRAAGHYPGDQKWAGMARTAIAILVPLSIIL